MVPGDDLRELRLPSLSVGDALRTTFHLYRRHFLTFALVMGIMAVPSVLAAPIAETWALEEPPRPDRNVVGRARVEYLVQSLGVRQYNGAIGSILSVPFVALSGGATIILASHLLVGRAVGVMSSYRQVWSRFVSLVGISLLLTPLCLLLIFSCVGILAIPYVFLGLEFVWQTVIVENRGPISAIRRSWYLAYGHRWRILLSGLVVEGIFLLLTMGPVHLLHWWTGVSHDSPLLGEGGLFGADPTTQAVWIADQTIYVVGQTVLFSLICILTTVLYFDLRAREAPAGPPKPLDLPSG